MMMVFNWTGNMMRMTTCLKMALILQIYYKTIETIVPEFVGWIRYGGQYIPGEVVSKNKRKKVLLLNFSQTVAKDIKNSS